MKRWIAFLLAVVMAFALCSCGGATPKAPAAEEQTQNAQPIVEEKEETQSEALSQAVTADADKDAAPAQTVKAAEDGADSGTKTAAFEVVSCRFVDTVHAADDELIGNYYDNGRTWPYVDTVVKVSDAGEAGISKDNTSGCVWFDDVRYELQYCKENLAATSVNDDPVHPHDYGTIHLFTTVPPQAESGAPLNVTFTIDGMERTVEIAPRDTAGPLSKKTELFAGDTITSENGDIIIEVCKCVNGKLLTSDPEHSAQYGGTRIDLMLRIENNGSAPWDMDHRVIQGYVIGSDGAVLRADSRMETEDHADLGWDSTIEAGTDRYVHFLAGSDKSGDDIFRFNFDGDCYYISIENRT